MLLPILGAIGVGYLVWRHKQPGPGFPGPIGPPAPAEGARTFQDDIGDAIEQWFTAIGQSIPAVPNAALWQRFCEMNNGVQWERVWPGVGAHPTLVSALATKRLPETLTATDATAFLALIMQFTDMVRRNTR